MRRRGLRQLPRRWLATVRRPLFIDLGGDHRDSVFVAGSERSGTTWLADLINFQGDFRLIFEPFWALKVPACKAFEAQQYLRPREKSHQYLNPASRILSGRMRNAWFDRYHRTVLSRRRMIKDVRANLLLRWLYVNFPGMHLVLILRHPCAVAASQELARHHFGDLSAHFLSQPALVEDYLKPYLEALTAAETPFEQRILRWCIQNFVPLSQFAPDELLVVFYEELCVQPEPTLRKILEHLDIRADASQANFQLPSPVSRKDSAVVSGGDLIEQWREFVTAEQVKRAVELLSLFGLDGLYDDSSLPHRDALATLMRQNHSQKSAATT